MARKESITKKMILEAAFSLAKEEGLSAVTARRVAQKAGCSTQPIFRIYVNMEDVITDVIEMTIQYFSDYYEAYEKTEEVPFVNLGLAYIKFAKENENLFRILFASHAKKTCSTYELINGKNQEYVLRELKKITDLQREEAGEIFSKIWIFIHGLACMVLNGDFDLSKEETTQMLKDIYLSLRKA